MLADLSDADIDVMLQHFELIERRLQAPHEKNTLP